MTRVEMSPGIEGKMVHYPTVNADSKITDPALTPLRDRWFSIFSRNKTKMVIYKIFQCTMEVPVTVVHVRIRITTKI